MKVFNEFLKVKGTAAERALFTDIADGTHVEFTETDTSDKYEWDGDSWFKTESSGTVHVALPSDLAETRTYKTYSTAAGTGEITNAVTRLAISPGATSLTVKYRDVSSATGVAITVVLNADDDTDEDGKGAAKEGLRVALGEQASVRFPSANKLTRIGLISDVAETGDSAVELSWGIPA